MFFKRVCLCGAGGFTLAVPCFDGVYLPKHESEFVHLVLEELQAFEQEDERSRVLLFPPLTSRLRYLTHRAVEDRPLLCSFSVGDDVFRRVAVCFCLIRAEVKDNSDNSSSLYDEDKERDSQKPQRTSTKNRTPKRPDQPLYLPRAVRERLMDHSGEDSAVRERITEQSAGEATDGSRNLDVGAGDALKNRCGVRIEKNSSHDGEEESSLADAAEERQMCRSSQKTQEVNGAEEEVWDEYLCSALTLENEGDSSAEGCESENTGADSETEEINEEIRPHLREGVSFIVDSVHSDFSSFESFLTNNDDFSHVIEIYDFPALFKTEDLLDAFTEYSEGGMKIKWVDNTHALGIFSCEAAALQALSISHPLLKTRALSQGSKKARGKALRRAEFLQPVKQRPRTDSAVARRMVTRALGLQSRGRGHRY